MLLLDYARNEVGVACKAFHHQHLGWTTDASKADLMRKAGAGVKEVPSSDKRPEGRKFDGFEITFFPGAEVVTADNPT
jgi:hypothetical protein